MKFWLRKLRYWGILMSVEKGHLFPGVCDTPVVFEPAFTLNGIPISHRLMSSLRLQWKADIGAAVTHLASPGVKRQETALWDYIRKRAEVRKGFCFYHALTIATKILKKI